MRRKRSARQPPVTNGAVPVTSGDRAGRPAGGAPVRGAAAQSWCPLDVSPYDYSAAASTKAVRRGALPTTAIASAISPPACAAGAARPAI